MDYLDDALPHRPPFRFIDRILETSGDRLTAEYTPRPDDPFWSMVYSGHYPGTPVTPGVLLCEMAFQAGAALLMPRLAAETGGAGLVPVVARVREAKLRRMVRPGQKVAIEARLLERLAGAYMLKGVLTVPEGEALRVEFTVAMAKPPEPQAIKPPANG